MKKYYQPEIKFLTFTQEDVLTESVEGVAEVEDTVLFKDVF